MISCFVLLTLAAAPSLTPIAPVGPYAPVRVYEGEQYYRDLNGAAVAVNLSNGHLRQVRARVPTCKASSAYGCSMVYDVGPAGLLVGDPNGVRVEPLDGSAARMLYEAQPPHPLAVLAAAWLGKGAFFIAETRSNLYQALYVEGSEAPRVVSTASFIPDTLSSRPRVVGDSIYWVEPGGGGWTHVRRYTAGAAESESLFMDVSPRLLDADEKGAWVYVDPNVTDDEPGTLFHTAAREKTSTQLPSDPAWLRVVNGVIYFASSSAQVTDAHGTRSIPAQLTAIPVGCVDRREWTPIARKLEGNALPVDVWNGKLLVPVSAKAGAQLFTTRLLR